MSHPCSALLCESPHSCDCQKCRVCHQAHMADSLEVAFWGDCPYCAEDIAFDIGRGVRCKHGQYVPDGYQTDIECQECEDAYEFAA